MPPTTLFKIATQADAEALGYVFTKTDKGSSGRDQHHHAGGTHDGFVLNRPARWTCEIEGPSIEGSDGPTLRAFGEGTTTTAATTAALNALISQRDRRFGFDLIETDDTSDPNKDAKPTYDETSFNASDEQPDVNTSDDTVNDSRVLTLDEEDGQGLTPV